MIFLIEYKVKPEDVEANEIAAIDFLEDVKDAEIEGVAYTSYKANDGVSFKHLTYFADQRAKDKFEELEGFKEFQEGIKSRAEEGPDSTELSISATTY